jgi:protein-S-isoprenylcysteine O-methyltransferase Ste14
MFTGVYQTIITLFVTLVFYTQDVFFISCYEKRRKAREGVRSRSFVTAASILVVTMTLQPIFLPRLSLVIPGQAGAVIQTIGIIIIVAALGLHIWARKHLRQFYAERIEIQRLHWVVESGPYALVRHPIYISYLLLSVGFMLINPGLITLAAAAFLLWMAISAGRKEERILLRGLPGYLEYTRRTHGFIPHFNKYKNSGTLEPRR